MTDQPKTVAIAEFGAHFFKGRTIRVSYKDGVTWAIHNDVCAALGIKNAADAADKLDDDEKGVALTDTLGGSQEMIVVNEPGVYRIIMRSRKPEAREFQRWLSHEVLPALRRRGTYTMGETPSNPTGQAGPALEDDKTAVALAAIMASVAKIDRRIDRTVTALPPSDKDPRTANFVCEYIRHTEEIPYQEVIALRMRQIRLESSCDSAFVPNPDRETRARLCQFTALAKIMASIETLSPRLEAQDVSQPVGWVSISQVSSSPGWKPSTSRRTSWSGRSQRLQPTGSTRGLG